MNESAFPYISVVVPVYNEEESLVTLVEEIQAALKKIPRPAEMIFVDDGSTDRSVEVLENLRREDGRIRIIRFKSNAGQSAAFEAGFRAVRGEVIATLDADLQNDPADIPTLLEMIGDYDVICGWRKDRQDPWIRLVSTKVANFVRNMVSREDYHDSACSLRVFRADCLDRVKLFNGSHRFLSTLMSMEGFRVCEVPVNHRPRRYGEAKYGISNRAFRAFHDLLAVRWMKSRALRYEISEEEAID